MTRHSLKCRRSSPGHSTTRRPVKMYTHTHTHTQSGAATAASAAASCVQTTEIKERRVCVLCLRSKREMRCRRREREANCHPPRNGDVAVNIFIYFHFSDLYQYSFQKAPSNSFKWPTLKIAYGPYLISSFIHTHIVRLLSGCSFKDLLTSK